MVVKDTLGKLMDKCAENRLGQVKGFLDEAVQRKETVLNEDYLFDSETGNLTYNIGPGTNTYSFSEDMSHRDFRELIVATAEQASDIYDPDTFEVKAGDKIYSIEGLIEDGNNTSTPFGSIYMAGKEKVESLMVFSAVESYVEDSQFFDDGF